MFFILNSCSLCFSLYASQFPFQQVSFSVNQCQLVSITSELRLNQCHVVPIWFQEVLCSVNYFSISVIQCQLRLNQVSLSIIQCQLRRIFFQKKNIPDKKSRKSRNTFVSQFFCEAGSIMSRIGQLQLPIIESHFVGSKDAQCFQHSKTKKHRHLARLFTQKNIKKQK